jgi:hypothetical protein
LVLQQEVLSHQLGVPAKARTEQTDEEDDVVEHHPVRMLPTHSKAPAYFMHL